MSSRPWLKPFPAGKGRGIAIVLMASGWLACGAAFWGAQSVSMLLTASRPPVTIEAFVSDLAGEVQVEELIQSLQAQPFCCEAKFVAPQEARAEAAMDKRVRRLLEAFGGNPFLGYVRMKLCPEFAASHAQASGWLKRQEIITSVRVPEAAIERMLAGEKKIRQVAWTAIASVFALGLLLAGSSLGLLGVNLGEELAVLETLGAGWTLVMRRIFLGLALPGVLLAGLAVLAIRMGILLAGFSTSWCTGPLWLTRMPSFSAKSSVFLLALALSVAAAVALAFFLRRVSRKPD